MEFTSLLILGAIASGFILLLYCILHPLDPESVARKEGVPYDPRGICGPGAIRPLQISYGRVQFPHPMAIELEETGLRMSEVTIRGALFAPLGWIKTSTGSDGQITELRIITGRGKSIRLHLDAHRELAARYAALVKSGRIVPATASPA